MYDSANNQVTRERGDQITSVASTSIKKYLYFTASKLKAVHGMVTVAGTDAAAGIDVYVGTASVGAVTFGSNTAGVLAHSGTIDADIPANGYVELKGKANSSTLAAAVVIETRPTPDSAPTP